MSELFKMKNYSDINDYFVVSTNILSAEFNPSLKVLAIIVEDLISHSRCICEKSLRKDEFKPDYYNYFKNDNSYQVTVSFDSLKSIIKPTGKEISTKQLLRLISGLNLFGYSFTKFTGYDYNDYITFIKPCQVKEGSSLVVPRFIFDLDLSTKDILTYIMILNNMLLKGSGVAVCTGTYLQKVTQLSQNTVKNSINTLINLGLIAPKSLTGYKKWCYDVFCLSSSDKLKNLFMDFSKLDKLFGSSQTEVDKLLQMLCLCDNEQEIYNYKTEDIFDETEDISSEIPAQKQNIHKDIFDYNNITYITFFNDKYLSHAMRKNDYNYLNRVIESKQLLSFKRTQVRKALKYGISKEDADRQISSFITFYLKILLENYHKYLKEPQNHTTSRIYKESLDDGIISKRKLMFMAHDYFGRTFGTRIKDKLDYSKKVILDILKKNIYLTDINSLELPLSVFDDNSNFYFEI